MRPQLVVTLSFWLALTLILPAGALALEMHEAVGSALKEHQGVRQHELLLDAAQEDVGASRAAFMPSIDLSYSYTMVETQGGGSIFSTNVAAASARASYNLFNGFSDLRRLQASQAGERAASFERDAARADIILEARAAYIDVLRAERTVKTAREGVGLLSRQRREAALFLREGLFAKNDVLKVEVELSTAQQELLSAEAAVRVARSRLVRVTGLALATDAALVDFEGLPEPQERSYDALAAAAIAGRSEIRALLERASSTRYSMQSTMGGYMPRIDLSAAYTRFGDKAYLDGRVFLHDSEVTATVTATWNVFDGFGKGHSAASLRYRAEAAEAVARDLEAEVLLQLREALEGYSTALGKLEAAKSAVVQARENYRVTESQFRNRIATTTDLLDAQFLLTRARNQFNNALYDAHLWDARILRTVEDNSPGGEVAGAEQQDDEEIVTIEAVP